MKYYRIQRFPKSRLSTIDVCEIGSRKHHVTGLVEVDVCLARKKIEARNLSNQERISFNAWLISVISKTLKGHENAGSFLFGKNSRIIFNDVNISLLVEKEVNNEKVPIPLIIEKANEKSVVDMTQQIGEAKRAKFTEKDVVLLKKSKQFERVYYLLPGFLRRIFLESTLEKSNSCLQKNG